MNRELEAAKLVPTATTARRLAVALGVGMVALLAVTAVSPWQQNVRAAGRVVAYAPLERRQVVEAAVNGRVARIWVREGSRVNAGDPLLEILDNDPQLLGRMQEQRSALSAKIANARAGAAALQSQIVALERGRIAEIASARAKLRAAEANRRNQEQKLAAAEAELETAAQNAARVRQLADRGLASTRELELARLSEVRGQTELEAARAALASLRDEARALEAVVSQVSAEADAKIEEVQAKLLSVEASVAESNGSLASFDVDLARQQAQIVRAPRAGVVLELLANDGGEQVKQGDGLLVLVPDAEQRAAELWVSGNDAALLREGQSVRLQFEGWPAVQFGGWPSLAFGTFGGRIAVVDAHDDGAGKFRIVIAPDPLQDAWPASQYLRQGVRAKGWVMLERVPLGYELWRRFNGFPPDFPGAPAPPERAENIAKR